MELTKGVTAEFKEGKAIIVADVGALLLPLLDQTKAKIESGEMDLIKGTDLEKAPVLAAIELIKGYLK